jgi:hypothetical protein
MSRYTYHTLLLLSDENIFSPKLPVLAVLRHAAVSNIANIVTRHADSSTDGAYENSRGL